MPEAILDRLAGAFGARYTVERELGAGGMATVYLAEDRKHHRKVAIKVLRPELAATLGSERFLREIAISAQLTHPHILPLFDSGDADGLLYSVMPYIEGETLRERLAQKGRLDVDEAVRLTDQVASALTYAHGQGIVHRDVKPENILLVGDQAVVADFGIAQAVEAAGGQRLTSTGLVVGTPTYMSPEQALGTDVDARTDVYALGCVVYEMLAGHPPFQGSTRALLAMHAIDDAPGLRTTDAAIPLYVERAVERALAREVRDRFATPQEFATALTTGTLVARVPRRRRIARALAAAGVVCAAVFAGLGGWWLGVGGPGARMERLAVLPLTDLSGDSSQSYLAGGVHEALITELGQLGLAVTARATMVRYQGAEKSIREIARELGVDGVIEGSVFRQGDSIEIATRLYDPRERVLWTASYEGVLANVNALYRGFARAIAQEVRVKLRPEAEARLASSVQVDPAVYEKYMRGMWFLNHRWNRRQDWLAAMDSAVGYFLQAVEQNPTDALAWANLAVGYVTIGHDGSDPKPDVWLNARAAAERAVRLDPNLAEGWAALADCRSYWDHDWTGAEEAFRRANELNPSLAFNHFHYSWFLVLFGRIEEAVIEHERARALDPLTPRNESWIPALYWSSGDYERAFRQASVNLEKYPNALVALHVFGESAARTGRFDEAIAAYRKLVETHPDWNSRLAKVLAEAGRTAEARRILQTLEAQPVDPWGALGLAMVHAALGNDDEALRWLAYEPSHAWVAWAAANEGFPEFEKYLGDPRLQALLRRVNLEMEPGDEHPRPLAPVTRPLTGQVTVR